MACLYNNFMFMLKLGVTCFCVYLLPISAELQRFEHPTKDDDNLGFLAVGDWGRNGTYNQSRVAYQMGRIGKWLDIDFVVSTGDNFYDDGLTSTKDPAFLKSFTNIYTAKSLQKPWYSVLGNHDYRGNVGAQLSPMLNKRDGRWHCLRSFIVSTGIADFFFVDTTPFVDKYFNEKKNRTYDWKGIMPRDKYLSQLLKDLDTALSKSTGRWKIVVGHHTIKSIGHHGDTDEVAKQVLPILEEHKVDMYINGHDHCLEHISSNTSQIQFLTSGGGSKAWRNDIHYERQKDNLRFYYDGQGFISVQLSYHKAKVIYYNVYGKTLHKLKIYKDQS